MLKLMKTLLLIIFTVFIFSGCSHEDKDVITTKSGLKYKDIVVGTGTEAVKGKNIWVHYTGTLQDGKKFDASYDRGAPLGFQLGVGHVIRGWDEGVAGMKVGGKRKLIIPPGLAYGEVGIPDVIPPNSTIIFDVELIDVKDLGQQ
jgi:FKBP-type peptidyl-prolyl cis-trans isomerase FkpA